MKLNSLIACSVVGLSFTSCSSISDKVSSLHGPITSAENDPLSSLRIIRPGQEDGSGGSSRSSAPQGPTYTPGQWVESSMPNTTFFRKKPGGGTASADKVLAAGAAMKVISTSGSYVKAELESGEVGYVPSIMISEQGGSSSVSSPTIVGSSDSSNQGDIASPSSVSVDSEAAYSSGLAPEPEIQSIKPPSAVADDILPLPPNPTGSSDALIDPNLDLETKISEVVR